MIAGLVIGQRWRSRLDNRLAYVVAILGEDAPSVMFMLTDNSGTFLLSREEFLAFFEPDLREEERR